MIDYPDFLSVRRIQTPADIVPEALPALLEGAGIRREHLRFVPWPKDYPYKPSVSFRIAHDGKRIFLVFDVSEESAAAVTGEDLGPVWKDSCVEFFLAPSGQEGPARFWRYYNFECNCIGKLLENHGVKGDRHPVPDTTLVKRWSSLGSEPFAEKGPARWQVAEIIPSEAFFADPGFSLAGRSAWANFYKCGDDLRTPHFISWAPIHTETPDFHRPEFFRAVLFEE